MKPSTLLCALLLGLAAASTAHASHEVTDPPECVRQGPPCGPGPAPCLQEDETCPVAMGCAVGDDREECLVSVHWVVCVTEPCDDLVVCARYGAYCSDRILP